MKRKKRVLHPGTVIKYLILLAVAFGVVFPFFWLIISSFKLERDIIHFPPRVFASTYTLMQYNRVFASIPILMYLKNTAIFAGSVAALSAFIDSAAAYAFARIKFKGSRLLFSLILVTMMIPFQILMIPTFLEVHWMGLLDTYAGLILPRMTSAYGIFLMRSFFVSLPRDLEEAARIDGLSEFNIYLKIMLPLCKTAMLTLFIFTLMSNWNDLLYPLMLTSKTSMRTLTAGLALFVGERVMEFGPTIASTLMSMAPLLLIYILAQRYFVQGIALSGIKE